MNVVGVIPARWASSRFEGKVLKKICDKPLIQYVWEAAKRAKLLDDLIIAADDAKVMDAAKKFGAKAVYTSPDQPSGTDRIAEVVNAMDVNMVVNIQGDEPLLKPVMIDSIVTTLMNDRKAVIATLIKKIENENEIFDSNIVKVVCDKKGYALYFSRSPIPYLRDKSETLKADFSFFKHIGLYVYTKDFLFTYTNLPSSSLERAEKLEQLRALEHGFKIKTVETKFDTVGVDTPEDLKKVKKILEKRAHGNR